MEPYYFRIKDPMKFLRHYLNVYQQSYNRTRAQKVIRLIPATMKHRIVLDVGCGGGFYSNAVYKRGARDIILLDLSPVCVKAAKINLRENTNYDRDGVIADARNLPFRNESFDFVILVDIIEHIKEDLVLIMRIKKLLKAGGLMVIGTQNSNSLNYILEAPLQRYILKNRRWMGWDPTHVRFYTLSKLIKLLKYSGLNVIKVSGTYFLPYMMASLLRRINDDVARYFYYILFILNNKLEKYDGILAPLGWGIFCLCQKHRSFKKDIYESSSS